MNPATPNEPSDASNEPQPTWGSAQTPPPSPFTPTDRLGQPVTPAERPLSSSFANLRQIPIASPSSVPSSPETSPTPTPVPVSDSVQPSPNPAVEPAVSQPSAIQPSPIAPEYAAHTYSPASGPVIGDMGSPSPETPASDQVAPAASLAPSPKQPRRGKKLLIILPVLLVLLGGSAAGYYFGYYTNPSVILSQSLSNTGKGYDELINYYNTQSTAGYKGITGSGSYSVDFAGTKTDGHLSYQSYKGNSDTTFDIGLGVTRVKAEIRSVKPDNSDTPDLYLKATGINGLGSLLSTSPTTNAAVNNLEGKWVAVDHTLIDNVGSSIAASGGATASTTPSLPSQSQIVDELKAFGTVNKQYVFTTKEDKSVTTVVKKYGIETVDGHKAYHYQMALDKANVKKYLTAQRDALMASQLGSWIKKNGYEKDVDSSYKDAQASADKISSDDNFDLWSDVSHRIVYKVRVAEPKDASNNYTDFGLDFKGGTSYPFFISGKSSSSDSKDSGSIRATLDSKTNTLALKLSLTSGTDAQSASSMSGNFTFKPSTAMDAISAPTGALPLTSVLSQLGLGDVTTMLTQPTTSIPMTTPTKTLVQ